MFPIRSSSYRTGDKEGDLSRMFNDYYYQTQAVGDWQPFNRELLEFVLQSICKTFNPTVIRMQDPHALYSIEKTELVLDHVDHVSGARIAYNALYGTQIPIYWYEGYPIRNELSNLDHIARELKTKMWRTYQTIDTSVGGEIWDDALTRCFKRIAK